MANKTLSRTSLVVVAIALLAVISLSQVLFKGWRIDLTENQLYTLSDGTRAMLAKIDEPVNLHFFYNPEVADGLPHIQTYGQRVREFLEELALAGGDQVNLTIVSPEPFSDDEDRATEFGVQAVPLNDGADNLYFGLAGTNSVDDVETIPFFQPNREGMLEYDVAKLVYSLSRTDKPVVGLLSTLQVEGSFDPQRMQPTPAWMSITQLREFFDVRTISADADTINADVDLLVLVHPAKLEPATLYAIDQFVMHGGRVVAFVDPYAETAAPRGGMMEEAGPTNSDLEPLLSAWGATVSKDVVGDAGTALRVQTQAQQRPSYHLALLGLTDANLNADDVVTQGLDTVNLGIAGYLQPAPEATTTLTPLISSTDQAAPIPSFKIQPAMNPASLQAGFTPTGETYVMAARLSGPAASAYGDAPPEGVTPAEEHLAQAQDDINVIVFADTDMLADRYWVQTQNFLGQTIATPFAANGDLLVNSVDNLLGSSDLIAIKSRVGFARPFTRVENMKRAAESRFLDKERELQSRLQETEAKLRELQAQKADATMLSLSPEQRIELEQFQADKLKIRKELRDVRHSLNKDIDALGTLLKFINIGLVPMILVAIALLLSWRRRRAQEVSK